MPSSIIFIIIIIINFCKIDSIGRIQNNIQPCFIFLSVKHAVEIINIGAARDNLRKLCMHVIIEVSISL